MGSAPGWTCLAEMEVIRLKHWASSMGIRVPEVPTLPCPPFGSSAPRGEVSSFRAWLHTDWDQRRFVRRRHPQEF